MMQIYQQMLLARFHVFNLIKELITLAPGPQLNGYFLYCQKCKREGKDALPAWNDAKEDPLHSKAVLAIHIYVYSILRG